MRRCGERLQAVAQEAGGAGRNDLYESLTLTCQHSRTPDFLVPNLIPSPALIGGALAWPDVCAALAGGDGFLSGPCGDHGNSIVLLHSYERAPL
jgi:hypothetical protein